MKSKCILVLKPMLQFVESQLMGFSLLFGCVGLAMFLKIYEPNGETDDSFSLNALSGGG